MDRVNLACSEAEDIRAVFSRDGAALEVLDRRGSSGSLYVVPFLLVRWWVRFGSLRMEDEDLIRARHDMKQYAFFSAVLVVVALFLVLLPLLHL